MKDLMYGRQYWDRAHALRGDSGPLLGRDDARFAVMWRDLSLVRADGLGAALLSLAEISALVGVPTEPIFLGLGDQSPLFAADLSHLDGGDSGPSIAAGAVFTPLRAHGPSLPVGEGALLAYARGMILWHRNHRYCAVCGALTGLRAGGHVRVCSNPDCGREHYPRTDPAVIMLVEDGDRILLHRQSIWPKGMWSCLAGFVEPGETLEDAVCREVREESGIEVDRIAYVESQPWPFPSSLMVAFTAKAYGGILAPDTSEIEDAQWFGIEDLAPFDDQNRQTGNGPFLAMPGTVARRMVDGWLAARRGT